MDANITASAAIDDSKSMTLHHVIASDGRRVDGVALIDSKLFVLRHPSRGNIEVYETSAFKSQGTVRVAGLRDGAWYKALASCVRENCLYVCDLVNVHRVHLSTGSSTFWSVDGSPTGLSVNAVGHVIVTCCIGNVIKEYTSDGKPVREIKVYGSDVVGPWHAVQLNEDRFVVSHAGPLNNVSIIECHRRWYAVEYYRDVRSKELFCWLQLAVAKNGSTLVIDRDQNRIVVLDSTLSETRDLVVPIDGQLSCPRCVYFDESRDRLYVGEDDGKRVLVFDNVDVSF